MLLCWLVLGMLTLLLHVTAVRPADDEVEAGAMQQVNRLEHREEASSSIGKAAPAAGEQYVQNWKSWVNDSSAPDYFLLSSSEHAAISGSEEGKTPQNAKQFVEDIGGKKDNIFSSKAMLVPGTAVAKTAISVSLTLTRATVSLGTDAQNAGWERVDVQAERRPIDVMIVLFVSPKSGGRVGSDLLSFGKGEVGQVHEMTFKVGHSKSQVVSKLKKIEKNKKGTVDPNLEPMIVQALFFDITNKCSRAAGKYAIRCLSKESNITMENGQDCPNYKTKVDDVIEKSVYAAVQEPNVPNVRAVAAGGDGTVLWLVDELYKVAEPPIKVPVGAIPFGTGNDLSRQLNTEVGDSRCQGAGSANDLSSSGIVGLQGTMEVLSKFALAPLTRFDVWEAVLKTNEGGEIKGVEKGLLAPVDRGCTQKSGNTCRQLTMTLGNYGSVGFESLIGLEFEMWRSTKTTNSQRRNKFEYFTLGGKMSLPGDSSQIPGLKYGPLKDFVKELRDSVFEEAEGEEELGFGSCDPSAKGWRGSRKSLVFMNVECIMGGRRKWPANGIPQPAYDDGLLEALSFQNPTTLATADGCAVGQYHAPQVNFRPGVNVPFQIDGEFFAAFEPSSFTIRRRESVQMLRLGTGHRGHIGSPTITFSS